MTVSHEEYGWSDPLPTCAHECLLPTLRALLRSLYRNESVKILDIGCGNGHVASCLADLGHQLTSVDVSRKGIDIARSAYPQVKFEVCSVYDDRLIETVEDRVDCVVSLEVVEHLFYPRKLFEQSARLLRNGGHLIVSTPYHGYLKNLTLSLVNGWDRHFGVGWHGGYIKYFSKHTLAQMAGDAGLGNPCFRGVGRFPGLWKSIVMTVQRQSAVTG